MPNEDEDASRNALESKSFHRKSQGIPYRDDSDMRNEKFGKGAAMPETRQVMSRSRVHAPGRANAPESCQFATAELIG